MFYVIRKITDAKVAELDDIHEAIEYAESMEMKFDEEFIVRTKG